METIGNLMHLWDESDDEERRGLIRNLFEYISIDLDKQEIVDFRLKPWADRFIVLRARLYEGGYDALNAEEKKNASSIQGLKRHMPPRGLEHPSVPHGFTRLEQIIYLLENSLKMSNYFKGKVYSKLSGDVYNPYDPTDDKNRRNSQILTYYNGGVSITTIANQFGLSPQRIHQIIADH